MRFSYILIIGFIIAMIGVSSAFLKPIKLGSEVKVEIPYGSSISKAGEILKENGVIESKEAFMVSSKLFFPRGIVAGTYSFSGKVTVFSALYNLSHGQFGRDQIKLTIPEGFTANEVIKRIYALFPNIDKEVIKNELSSKEGYIFPETYFFDKEVRAEDLLTYLENRSNSKLQKLLNPITLNSTEAKRILIVASLVESEGRTKTERQMITGIINNRLKIGMPLQLDATLQYITGKGSSELTLNDLKIESAYNTYLHKGLPPTPISNPGAESIWAAQNPIANDYLYYLHDNDGNIHYAKTLTEHAKNKARYLK